MMDLRPVDLVHADLLSGMHTICFSDAWSPSSMAEILAMPGAGGLLAVDGGSLTPSSSPPGPAGFVLWRMVAGEAEILSIAVLPPWRRHGLGRQLLDAALMAAGQAGMQVMYLEVAVDNTAARMLYQDCGFCQVGLRKGYYEGKDALVLRTDL